MSFKKFFYKKVNSTNDLAIKKIKVGITKGIIIADYQKKGRGQHGKKWLSFKGNLFISIFFKIKENINLKKITILNCKIIKKILFKYIIKSPEIKNYPTTNILKETGFKVKKYDLIKNIEKNYIKNLKLFA